MNLYKISVERNLGYDTYDSAVVAAETEEEARLIHPTGNGFDPNSPFDRDTWVKDPTELKVELIGKAKPETRAGVILASFNAG